MSSSFQKFGKVYATHRGVERVRLRSESISVIPADGCVMLTVQVGGSRTEVFNLDDADCLHLASLILAARRAVWPGADAGKQKQPQQPARIAQVATETVAQGGAHG